MTMIKNCLYCGKEFEANSSSQKFCCIKHRSKYKWENGKEITKHCKSCWKEFKTKSKRTIFCSPQCSWNFTKDQVKQTCLNKYWVEYVLQSEQTKEKKKQTCLNKYWVEYITQTSEFKERSRQTCLEKYWTEFASKTDWFRDEVKQTCLSKYWVKYISQTKQWKDKYKQTCLKKYWKTNYLLTDWCKKPWVISKENEKRANIIHEATWLNIEFEFTWIEWYSYDLKVWKFLFEIDPTVTHNSSKSFLKHSSPKDKYYHQKKSLAAEKGWYHCIHLFDWDDNNIVKDWIKWLLCWRKRLYHWEVRKVSSKEAIPFYDANHLQWKCWGWEHYWLYVNNQLINCMSFTCFNWEWQLVRFASLKWYRIAHWAEKLFKAFIAEHNPNYIVSFSDITKHSGWLYNALWFKLEKINEPSYWRSNKTWTNVYWRRECQKQNMHKLEWFDPNYKYLEHKDDPFWQQTEKELMESHWYLRVFDSGMRKHVWRK